MVPLLHYRKLTLLIRVISIMRLIVKAQQGEESRLVVRLFREEIGHIGAFSIVELVLGDSDEVSVTDAHARISMDLRNDFVREKDEKAVRFMVAQRIFLANIKRLGVGEPFIEEILVNKALAKAGYEDNLVYYYYSLFSTMKTSLSFEEFMTLNVPWLSLHGIDDYDEKFFLDLKSRFSYKENYKRDTAELFEMLKGDLKGPAVVKAVRLYRGLYAGNQI